MENRETHLVRSAYENTYITHNMGMRRMSIRQTSALSSFARSAEISSVHSSALVGLSDSMEAVLGTICLGRLQVKFVCDGSW